MTFESLRTATRPCNNRKASGFYWILVHIGLRSLLLSTIFLRALSTTSATQASFQSLPCINVGLMVEITACCMAYLNVSTSRRRSLTAQFVRRTPVLLERRMQERRVQGVECVGLDAESCHHMGGRTSAML